jgi:MFS family permease
MKRIEVARQDSSRTIFAGWYVVAALFTGGFMLYGGGLYAFILFVPPLAREFHWSSASTGALVSAFWISAPLSLWAQPLIRRFGERRLCVAGILIEAFSLMLVTLASSLWGLYALRALAGFGKVLFAITLPVIMSKWFSRRFGLAVAIMFSGWHLGGLGLASLTEYLLLAIGWRATSVVLGVAQLAIALPATLLGLRLLSAAHLGLGLDGDPLPAGDRDLPETEAAAGAARADYLPLLRELFRLPLFRTILVASPIYYLAYGGVLLQQAAVVQGAGATPYVSSLVIGTTAGCAAIGAIAGGWVLDRWSFLVGTITAFGLLGEGILLLLLASREPSLQLLSSHALIFGLGVGCGDIFWITLLKRRIPPHLFTSAWGIWYFQGLAFLIVAPAIAGAIFDVTRSYLWMLSLEASILLISFLVTFTTVRSRSACGG